MNTAMIGGTVSTAPQMRYTTDNQTPIAEFTFTVPGLKEEDQPTDIKAVIWGNKAQDAHSQIQPGQAIVLQGRLSMRVVERPEGFKEKQAEMTVSQWFLSFDDMTGALTGWAPPATTAQPQPAAVAASQPAGDAPSYDDIPF